MKILTKPLTMSIYPKITKNQLNYQLIFKNQKPILKFQTLSELKCLKTLRTDTT